jgi:hypothetical protein
MNSRVVKLLLRLLLNGIKLIIFIKMVTRFLSSIFFKSQQPRVVWLPPFLEQQQQFTPPPPPQGMNSNTILIFLPPFILSFSLLWGGGVYRELV